MMFTGGGRISHLLVGALVLSLLAIGLAGCGGGGRQLTIGSTNYAEPWILGEIAAVLLEDAGFEVEHIRNFQGSTLLHSAMIAGELDLYPSWTGTQFTGVLKMEVTDEWRDRDKVYDYVYEQFNEQYDQTWSPPFGFNNTYILAVREEFAEEHNLHTTSDLKDLAPELVIAVDQTFQERTGDGYNDLLEHYDFEFEEAVAMDYGLMYRAVAQGDVDVAVAYSTDGRTITMDLQTLEDDLKFFPPYDGAMVMRNEILEQYPEIEEILSPMWGAFDEDTMGALNAEVDVHEKEYDDVAREFVEDMGWID
ncbi:MAG: glycine betaine ABC transporter substrate-binding protein [Bacillota bacterium]